MNPAGGTGACFAESRFDGRRRLEARVAKLLSIGKAGEYPANKGRYFRYSLPVTGCRPYLQASHIHLNFNNFTH